MTGIPYHKFSNVFPLMNGEEFETFVADIKANGLRKPITLYQGKILEGRNRYRACLRLKIEPQFEEFEGDDADAYAFVISKNISRRHLKPADKKKAAADLLRMKPEQSDRSIARQVGIIRGYILADFREAFERYLAPEGVSQPPSRPERDEIRTSDIFKPHSPGNGCADVKCEKPNNDGLLGGCAVANGGGGKKTHIGGLPPACAVCGKSEPPPNQVAVDGLVVRLHPGCEAEYSAGIDGSSRKQPAPVEARPATNGAGAPPSSFDAVSEPTDDPEQPVRPQDPPAETHPSDAGNGSGEQHDTAQAPSPSPPRPILPGDRRREEQRARNLEALRRFETELLKGRAH